MARQEGCLYEIVELVKPERFPTTRERVPARERLLREISRLYSNYLIITRTSRGHVIIFIPLTEQNAKGER